MRFTLDFAVAATAALLGLATTATVVAGADASRARATRSAPRPQIHTLPPLREQAALVDGWTAERAARIPDMLERRGVDAWVLSQREYAEETAFWALKPFASFSARRRTTYLFLSSALAGNSNTTTGEPEDQVQLAYRWIDNTPDLWLHLRGVLEKHQPRQIAVNAHPEISFASGLHAGELETMRHGLGEKWAARLVTDEAMLGVELVATMVEARLGWYKRMMETAWAIIEEAFSSEVIVPGVTTTEDVEWWMRDRIQSLNYTTWFQPGVNIVTLFDFNPNATNDKAAASTQRPIQYGDVLHTDFGVTALGLNTDTQHLAYVVPPGQSYSVADSGILKSLHEGLHKANRMQDIVRGNMKIGLTGNEILKASREQMAEERIKGKIYCHPTGEFGHSAGTVIGMTNLQDGVPVLGELPLLKDTYYSIELYAEHLVPELKQTLNFYQEEDVFWNGSGKSWDWVYGRQDEFILIDYSKQETEVAEL
ncbi:xaa-Pro aminopeptidase family enzyme [Microdochium bolleyi]|uniref:Xaa-Pro aminopeptidase family enzyme n=1 Tax=Microdochium bolleyi TaxID=196109 RepID=A0A136IWV8_9PEZI|nr:xaa-Pro aminopeptidase family enzyme [Microdochium bolleyi]